jgi:UDP:flavonoid glycosyltransferase YjiC (YdhE family)
MLTHARLVLQRGPSAVAATGVEALIVDECDVAAGTVADLAGLPFVSLCLSPPRYLDDHVPPPYFGWMPGRGPLARARNWLGNAFVSRRFAPLLATINSPRRAAGLPLLRTVNDLYSPLAILTQLPKALDFPRPDPPARLIHVGPLLDPAARRRLDFPWTRLNGKPLIYASVGTLLNQHRELFETIAKACDGLDAQLVLSLGGGRLRPDDLGPLPAEAVCVHYAPQLDLLARAGLTLTHGGLNTVLESLAAGVPVVAIPVNNDQPGIAARLQWSGTGASVPWGRLSVRRLRSAVQRVLGDGGYRANARTMQAAMQSSDALSRSADVIERVLWTQLRARRPPRLASTASATR